MVLQVGFDYLAEEAKRHNARAWVYLSRKGAGVVATIGEPSHHLVIQAESMLGYAEASAELTKQGLLVAHGRWLPDPLAGEIQIEESIWVASVAYRSATEKPGLWVHGYRGEPSVGDVLRDFAAELSEEAGLTETPTEVFLAQADPNVVIVGPDELSSFAGRSSGG